MLYLKLDLERIVLIVVFRHLLINLVKKDKNKSLRKKSNKVSGGQIGHKVSTLEKVDNIDFVVELPNEICPHCAANLKNVKVEEVRTRQVFDIPKIKINVTEYQAHLKTCPHCNKKSISEFPENVTHNAQYGANIKGLILNWFFVK